MLSGNNDYVNFYITVEAAAPIEIQFVFPISVPVRIEWSQSCNLIQVNRSCMQVHTNVGISSLNVLTMGVVAFEFSARFAFLGFLLAYEL